jgi:hypothetical protein
LTYHKIPYKIFNYLQRYNEAEYLTYLQSCKYGIWIDAHESQGFALEEALSCNVPLLVWNVSSLNREENSDYPDVPATPSPIGLIPVVKCFIKRTTLPKHFKHLYRRWILIPQENILSIIYQLQNAKKFY